MFEKRLKKFLKNKLSVIGFLIFTIILLAVIFAPFITSHNPVEVNLGQIAHSPSKEHILGTDKLGRDVFARILYGGRISILVGFSGAFMGALIGTILGAIAGYFGGKIDAIIVRISEVFLTFPNLIVILILASILGSGIMNIIIVFSLTGWMTTFRMIRAEFKALKEETYVEVVRSFGASNTRIIFKNILPNALSPIIVSFSINIAGFILAEAGLSFLGVGVPSDVPTWGNIINASKSLDVIKNNWWLWIAPGTVISLFVLSVNFLGDGIRDFADPKQ